MTMMMRGMRTMRRGMTMMTTRGIHDTLKYNVLLS